MGKLKLVLYNVWGLPWPVSKDFKKRIRKIPSFLLKNNPDIICLQEVWLYSTLNFFKKVLKGYHCTTSGKGLFFNLSGLATFTKQKPISKRFTKFKTTLARYDEFVAGKGFLDTEIKIDEKNFHIINTHLFLRRSKRHNKIFQDQPNLLKNSLNKKDNYIFAGDMNMSFRDFSKWKPEDLLAFRPNKPTLYEKNPYQSSNVEYIHGGKVIDHVAVKSDFSKIKLVNEIPNPEFHSDHMPVISKIEFSK